MRTRQGAALTFTNTISEQLVEYQRLAQQVQLTVPAMFRTAGRATRVTSNNIPLIGAVVPVPPESATSVTRRNIPLSGAAVPDPALFRTVGRATSVTRNSGNLLSAVMVTPASSSLRRCSICKISMFIPCVSTDAGGP